ncbi:hypothetical protein [Candidatus Accumulibacter necessarius]|uniref:hypothetical protein n=1 Tax=Candidatus Accumulibacter necessarius TaxID=2954386 RepID=UPI003DA7C3D9
MSLHARSPLDRLPAFRITATCVCSTRWSTGRPAVITCRASSHTDPANPLRAEGRLGAASGIEYAAQAMAVHGALLAEASEPPRQGYLTSLRGVTLHVARLDDLPGELKVRAERLSGDGRQRPLPLRGQSHWPLPRRGPRCRRSRR